MVQRREWVKWARKKWKRNKSYNMVDRCWPWKVERRRERRHKHRKWKLNCTLRCVIIAYGIFSGRGALDLSIIAQYTHSHTHSRECILTSLSKMQNTHEARARPYKEAKSNNANKWHVIAVRVKWLRFVCDWKVNQEAKRTVSVTTTATTTNNKK